MRPMCCSRKSLHIRTISAYIIRTALMSGHLADILQRNATASFPRGVLPQSAAVPWTPSSLRHAYSKQNSLSRLPSVASSRTLSRDTSHLGLLCHLVPSCWVGMAAGLTLFPVSVTMSSLTMSVCGLDLRFGFRNGSNCDFCDAFSSGV